MLSGTVKHLEGKLWEVRVSAASRISRAIYLTATGKLVVIVRGFVKKTQKTPQRELTGKEGLMTKLDHLHDKWMKEPEHKKAYDDLSAEFALAAALIKARADADMTQEQVA